MKEVEIVPEKNSISFILNDSDKFPIIHLKENGDIYIKGKLISNDLELIDAMREFLRGTGNLK